LDFTEADYTTNTSAKADMFVQGAVFGDCGGQITVSAILDQDNDPN